MHQHPRPSPRSSTPATNPTTQPERTNNQRETQPPPTRNRSSVDLTAYTERGGAADASNMAGRGDPSSPGGSAGGSGLDKENVRLNQIIQQFHTKSALMICGSRAQLPPAYSKTGEKRQNRWFNIVIDETDVLFNDLQEWRRPDLYLERPSPLVIEIYLDTSHLPHNQALLCIDDRGRPREVVPMSSRDGGAPFKNGKRYREIVLERWTIELGDPASSSSKEASEPLPSVYKKGIVAFRTLYSFLRLLPAWKLYRQLGRQPGNQNLLRIKFRLRQAHELTHTHTEDPLHTPLFASDYGVGGARSAREATQPASQTFADLSSPAGPLRTRVDFRRHCEFTVADSESVISAALLSSDQRALTALTGRSLPGDRTEQHRHRYSSTAAPAITTTRDRPRALLGAYGSLGTIHQTSQPHRGSPLSELRQRAFDIEGDHDDEMDRLDALRHEAGAAASPKRVIPPPGYFKDGPMRPSPPQHESPLRDGSLTSSPRLPPSPKPSPHPIFPPSPKYASGSSSKRTSLNTLPQQQLRTPSLSNEVAVSSASSSPKPGPGRYSSSFANRPRRWTSQSNKTAESNTSSGRGSSSSKEKLRDLAEGGTPGSSGSAGGKTDDDHIADFIKDLERSKDITFAPAPAPPTAGSPSPARKSVIVDLSKYSKIGHDSSLLADEMSSSSLIHQASTSSTTPPSRRLSNVPGLSTSSSPSRALAHAPHVRSRLSTHSIVEEGSGGAGASSGLSGGGVEEEDDDDELPFLFTADS